MNLVLVESPTKARTLGRFLGKEYAVDSTMGHVRDLPKSKLGIDIEHNFEPEYVLLAKKKDAVGRIKEEAKKADRVFLATDPDREGEAIAWHVAGIIKENKKTEKQKNGGKVMRIVFHEITEQAVKEALEHPTNINLQLVDAQQARRVLDRLVGYKLSPLLWKKVRRGLSAGRVQSVAVRLIVEREREIEAFKPEEYWEVFVQVAPADAKAMAGKQVAKVEKVEFSVKLIKKDGEKVKIENKEQADGVVSDLEKAAYRVSLINKREVHKSPYPPFTTSTMAQAASRLYFWSAKKTMSIAQKLYEEGLITYHRTDSTNLSEQAVKMALLYIKEKYGDKFLPEKPRIYKTKSKVAQEAHEAVRPTDVNFKFQISNFKLGRDGEILYGLIWKRFVACQMAKAVYDETTIDVEAQRTTYNIQQTTKDKQYRYLLRSSGQVIKFEGWRVLYPTKTEEGAIQLPEVVENEQLQLIKVEPNQKFTEPPARFTEASLVKTLEKLGIGRPSTYAPTISTIQDRQYVEKNEGKFQPTSLGNATNDFLIGYFPDVFDYDFTAHMEGSLDEIANGEKEWVPVINKFWKPFSDKLEKVEDVAKRVKIEVEKTGDKCPECKIGDQVIRVGKFGKFLSCSRFPECRWSANYTEKINMKCPGCGEGDVIIRKTKKGRRFYGCSRYPACKWASWKKPT
ncbi:MAG: type I DNA topoisomerase [Candidatus Blackburnbacteria bacterium]|nr:type I DNA topoisomerase [Candidatus Blackburnbacteria bacterium]